MQIRPERLLHTNMCPFCFTSFSTVANARQHMRLSLRHGRCLADRSVWPQDNSVTFFECLLCDWTTTCPWGHCWHIQQHVKPPEHLFIEETDTEPERGQESQDRLHSLTVHAPTATEERKRDGRCNKANRRRRTKQVPREGNEECEQRWIRPNSGSGRGAYEEAFSS